MVIDGGVLAAMLLTRSGAAASPLALAHPPANPDEPTAANSMAPRRRRRADAEAFKAKYVDAEPGRDWTTAGPRSRPIVYSKQAFDGRAVGSPAIRIISDKATR